jgi:membrane-anchored protein YejM (alkaline phosphatase superfamily)
LGEEKWMRFCPLAGRIEKIFELRRGVVRVLKIVLISLLVLSVLILIFFKWRDGQRFLFSKASLSPEVKNPYNVVIITIDNLRADHLGCYGYERSTSPNIDLFARQSMLFSQAYSTSSFTPPAHASLFTSKYVGDHGLVTWNKLNRKEHTLAEVLKENGYATAASVSLNLLFWQNLGQGFNLRRQRSFKDSDKIIQDALHIIAQESQSPFFLWLHLYDVHRPYGRHPDWKNRFAAQECQGVGDSIKHYNLWSGNEYKDGNSLENSGFSPADLQFLADRYDAGIGYVDSLLKTLLKELSNPGRLDDTLVILTSDHGENLLEHKECLFSHDPFLYSVVTQIPLLIRYPGASGAGKKSHEMVSLIDIAPTVLETIGLPVPASFSLGKSLLPLLRGDSDWGRMEIYMECWGWAHLKAVRSRERLVIEDLNEKKVVFYDLKIDPGEMSPYFHPKNEADQDVLGKLEAFSQGKEHKRFLRKIDPETKRMLKSLGYIK